MNIASPSVLPVDTNRRKLVVAGVAVVALALFAGGYTLGANMAATASKPTATTPAADGAAGGGGARTPARPGGAGGAGGGANAPLNGRIISVNADSITIAVTGPRVPGQAGQPSASPLVTSSIVLVGNSTRVLRTTETDIKLADLKANDQVTVIGQTDAATGTVSAQTVVIGGAGLFGGLFGGGQGGQVPGSGTPRPSVSPTR